MHVEAPKNPVHGMIAEFDGPDEILEAAVKTKEAGFKKIEAYTPFPVHGLADVIDKEDHRVKWIIFLGGAMGVAAGYGLQYWVSVYAYAHNVGGKPLQSWPAFIPITFECMVLFASFAAVIGMLGLNGLPRPHHPIFNAKNFEFASRSKFFLCVEVEDEKYDRDETEAFLKGLGAKEVSEVLNG
ncbi:MAG: DUF3341 domain-containing protein [Fimbriimonadaceae bacterium]|nr:DUF3341 domain-containing protein [Fimbriimonadaceae bacterium]